MKNKYARRARISERQIRAVLRYFAADLTALQTAQLVAYILEGELTVDYKDRGRRVYCQGEALLEAMDVPHRGLNLGKDPVRLLAVYLGAEGTPNVALDK